MDDNYVFPLAKRWLLIIQFTICVCILSKFPNWIDARKSIQRAIYKLKQPTNQSEMQMPNREMAREWNNWATIVVRFQNVYGD